MTFVDGIPVILSPLTVSFRAQSPYNTLCKTTIGSLVGTAGITLVQFTHFTTAILQGSRNTG
jgi:hypothetical protein